MALMTAAEALSKLNEYNSIDGLKQLTSQVTGKVIGAAEDAEHFLYSYNLNADGSGIAAKTVVMSAVENGKGVWIRP
jgi:hypothetical protein